MIRTGFRFPGAVILAAFLFFTLTLSWGVTESSLSLASKVAGWDWQPLASWPLVWLLTLPLHLLPAGWLVPALNLLAAAIAALTLGVLVRSIELMPWDCQPDPRRKWARQLPMILGAVVCGLEFSFWRGATAATGEMLDLLLLAVPIWCLLEFRAERAQGREELTWLSAAALVWGLGMAESWVMQLGFPVFALAVIFLRGLEFVDKPFLRRQAGLCLAGFSLILLLPLYNWLNPHSPLDFRDSWLASLRPIKAMLQMVFYEFLMWHRPLLVAVLLYYLLPTLPCFMRMNNEGAVRTSELESIQIIFYRASRVLLLLACLWLVFDPGAGLRIILEQKLAIALPLLTFDYLNALGIAFVAGNLLYAAQGTVEELPWGLFEKLNYGMRRAGGILVVGIFLAMVTGLLWCNLPAIRQLNQQPLQAYGRSVVHSLPPGGGVVLSPDLLQQEVVQAALAQAGHPGAWQVVSLNLLPFPKYRASLERETPSRWPVDGRQLTPVEVATLLTNLARTQPLVALQAHPGVPWLENFQPVPLGAACELQPCPAGRLERPELPADRLVAGEKFWDAEMAKPSWPGTSARPARKKWWTLEPVTSEQARLLGAWYSTALNDWGVQLQVSGKPQAARRRFEQALRLNPRNQAAEVNLQCATNLLAGKTLNLAPFSQVEEQFGSLQQLSQVIDATGEFDEPTLRCVIGQACLAAGWVRQAWQQFDRARVLAPNALLPELSLGQVYAACQQEDKVWEIVNRLRPQTGGNPRLDVDLSMLETRYWMAQTNQAQANRTLAAVLEKHPGDPAFADMVFKAYLVFGQATNALQMVAAQLARNPNSLAALNNQAALLILTRNAAAAIPVLDQVLALTNLPAIRLNRAVAFLQLQNYDAAEQDYVQLENSSANQFNVEYGLATIATQRRDTNAIIQHLKRCLPHASPKSAQWNAAWTQLNALTNNPAR